MTTIVEPARELPMQPEVDVLVCGGGPAGFAAAVAAARTGARTALLEGHGCLGGVWTTGLLSCVLEADKPGLLRELTDRLDRRAARTGSADSFIYDSEAMKVVLDEMVSEAGVRVQLHTRVTATHVDAQNRIRAAITESSSGRQGWPSRIVIDATGDGDVAAQAGCAFDYGHPETGEAQPMTLMALVTGLRLEQVAPFVAGGVEPKSQADIPPRGDRYRTAKDALLGELSRAGVSPSYQGPTLWGIHPDVYALMANHQYGVSPFDAADVTKATMEARAELDNLAGALRSIGPPWERLRVVATASQIGIREGRRIRGHYRLTLKDLREGTRQPDAVCRVRSGADVHALRRSEGGYLSGTTHVLQNASVANHSIPPVRPYDVPLRSLIARDVDGLMMAGRCISGDFFAHASYRVTGNAVAMGQAAGVAAALAAQSGELPQHLPWESVAAQIDALLPHARS